MDVSKNSGTPKSSILIGFYIINHPFWGTLIFGNIQMNHDSSFIFPSWWLNQPRLKKYDIVKLGSSSPRFGGEHTNNIWNHHPVNHLHLPIMDRIWWLGFFFHQNFNTQCFHIARCHMRCFVVRLDNKWVLSSNNLGEKKGPCLQPQNVRSRQISIVPKPEWRGFWGHFPS